MSALGDIESAAVGAVSGGIWKIGAIGLLLAMISSSAYLGYEWHAAASARDTAVTERARAEGQRDKALADNGELAAHIASQNKSIGELSTKTAIAQAQYDTAMQLLGPIKRNIATLAASIAAIPRSTTCAQSLAKQRAAIDGLRKVQP